MSKKYKSQFNKEGVGIAGAEHYVPTNPHQEGWRCEGCQQIFTKPSAVAWVNNGLRQECAECYEKRLLKTSGP
mgnify:FL=1